MRRGQVLTGCKANDPSLPHLAQRISLAGFAWASDYSHEVIMAPPSWVKPLAGGRPPSPCLSHRYLNEHASTKTRR